MRRQLVAVLAILTLWAAGQAGTPVPADAATSAYSHVAVYAGSACATSPASLMAVQPTGVLNDGAGGFYVAIADGVHAMICHVAADGSVTPFAGNGTPGFIPAGYGDGVDAKQAQVYDPFGMAVHDGSVYFAERMNNLVRKVDRSGVISIVAGNGMYAYGGDGGAATAAALNQPEGVAVAADGRIYIADTSNDRIRRVDPSGVITTIAGTGQRGFGGDGGPATTAQLNGPADVAIGLMGEVYFSDQHNNRVRRIDPNGTITTVAGSAVGYSGDGGSAVNARLNNPVGLLVNPLGELVIADANNSAVRKIDALGRISTIAGGHGAGFSGDGGPATQAQLSWPLDVSQDDSGGLLIADNGNNNRVRRVDVLGRITTVAGNGTMGFAGDGGPATKAEISQVNDVTVDGGGNVYIADAENNAIRKVAPSGQMTTIAGGPNDPLLYFPSAVLTNTKGDVFISDSWHHRVLKRASTGAITAVAGTGTGGYSGDGGKAASARLNIPIGLALDNAGNLYIADSGNNVIRRVTPGGTISTFAGTGTATGAAPLGDGGSAKTATFNAPVSLAFDPARRVMYVADSNNQRVRKITMATGIIVTTVGTGARGFSVDGTAANATMLNTPHAVAVDASGQLFISDHGNCIVRQVDAAGKIATVAGWTPVGGIVPTCNDFEHSSNQPRAWMLQHPLGLAFDASGRLFVADASANKVLVLTK